MKPNITVVGSANVDYIMQVDHLPAAGETVIGGSFSLAFGGKGANQAVAAARAGGSVTFVGALGSDATAEAYLAGLKADGIDTAHVAVEADMAGGAALIMVDGQGRNCITVAPGANSRLTPDRALAAESLIAASDWIVLQQEIPVASNRAVLELATQHGRSVMLNYAPANDLALKPDAKVSALVVNEVEAASLAGATLAADDRAAAGQVAAGLRDAGGHRFVIITLGEEGSVLADESGTREFDAFRVTPADTTAAGDTFCGALAVSLGEGRPLPEAVRFASAASALSVTRVGAQSSIPARSEIETFLSTRPA